MSKVNKIINNLAKQTMLLESLGWQEDLLEELYSYLTIHFEGDSIVSPGILLEDIEKKFGEDCAEVLRSFFVAVSLLNGLFMHDPDVEN